MDTIDLDAIINNKWSAVQTSSDIAELKDCMKEAIHQALVLFAKKARIIAKPDCEFAYEYNYYVMIDEQSILDVEKLIN